MLPIITMLLPLLSSVVGKIIPDAGQAAQINAALQRALIERQGEIDKAIAEAAKAQADVNLEEAKSPSLFIAGWRPACGWVCVLGLSYSVIQPALHLPAADLNSLIGILGGMLGLGAMRTAEKIADVPPTVIKPVLRRGK